MSGMDMDLTVSIIHMEVNYPKPYFSYLLLRLCVETFSRPNGIQNIVRESGAGREKRKIRENRSIDKVLGGGD